MLSGERRTSFVISLDRLRIHQCERMCRCSRHLIVMQMLSLLEMRHYMSLPIIIALFTPSPFHTVCDGALSRYLVGLLAFLPQYPRRISQRKMTPFFICAPFMLTLTVVRILPFVNGILKISPLSYFFYIFSYILYTVTNFSPIIIHYNSVLLSGRVC